MEKWLSNNWCGLNWSDWAKLEYDSKYYKNIDNASGIYRIQNVHTGLLCYIGQSSNLRKRIPNLKSCHKEMMPFNDPHVAAPALWAYLHSDKYQFEYSYALSGNISNECRKGLEDSILWQYSFDSGKRTDANYGKMHPRYTKSSKTKEGIRGILLETPYYQEDLPALRLSGQPIDSGWMELAWTDFQPLTRHSFFNKQAVYKIKDVDTNDIIYIGETDGIKKRIISHRSKFKGRNTEVSISVLNNTNKSQRLQLESDLLGSFFYLKQQHPEYNYKGRK